MLPPEVSDPAHQLLARAIAVALLIDEKDGTADFSEEVVMVERREAVDDVADVVDDDVELIGVVEEALVYEV